MNRDIKAARGNLAQIERWQPNNDFGRRMKQLNVQQCRAYLGEPQPQASGGDAA